MHLLGIFQVSKKSRTSLTIIQERQLERQLADASLSSGWTRMMGAVEGVTGLHQNWDGNTITETQEGAEKRPWNSLQNKSKDCEKLTWTWLFRCFSQCWLMLDTCSWAVRMKKREVFNDKKLSVWACQERWPDGLLVFFFSDITNIDEQKVWRKIVVSKNEETTSHQH